MTKRMNDDIEKEVSSSKESINYGHFNTPVKNKSRYQSYDDQKSTRTQNKDCLCES